MPHAQVLGLDLVTFDSWIMDPSKTYWFQQEQGSAPQSISGQ